MKINSSYDETVKKITDEKSIEAAKYIDFKTDMFELLYTAVRGENSEKNPFETFKIDTLERDFEKRYLNHTEEYFLKHPITSTTVEEELCCLCSLAERAGFKKGFRTAMHKIKSSNNSSTEILEEKPDIYFKMKYDYFLKRYIDETDKEISDDLISDLDKIIDETLNNAFFVGFCTAVKLLDEAISEDVQRT